MQLSKRLQMNVSLVPAGAKVADVGCDHGYASIWLLTHQVAERVIAMDVNRGPIARAKDHVRQAGLENHIICRQSDGLEKLVPGEVDTVMMAGMGGPLMIRILEEGKTVMEQVTTLVLQPQSELSKVREYLIKKDFVLTEEKACVDEGKYYFAMRAERCPSKQKQIWEEEWQYRYGTYLVQKGDPVLEQFLQKEKKMYRDILESSGLQETQSERKFEILHRINEIDKCLMVMQRRDHK